MRVWIEILSASKKSVHFLFHPLMRVWIEITFLMFNVLDEHVSPSYEGVDWNFRKGFLPFVGVSFTLLWGCGLKSSSAGFSASVSGFTLLWGCGLKSKNLTFISNDVLFHPLMRVWIEIHLQWPIYHDRPVSPSYEGVDWNYFCCNKNMILSLFHPLMRVWIEISWELSIKTKILVSPSYEGVDWNLLLLACYGV